MSVSETLALVAGLRDLGVSKAKFGPDGQIASVAFGFPVLVGAEESDESEPTETPWDRVLRGGDVS